MKDEVEVLRIKQGSVVGAEGNAETQRDKARLWTEGYGNSTTCSDSLQSIADSLILLPIPAPQQPIPNC